MDGPLQPPAACRRGGWRRGSWPRAACGRPGWWLLAFAAGPLTAAGFEVFSEQQILRLGDNDTRIVEYNNTELGSTVIDDFWAKIDYIYSPLDGWNLIKYVRMGCFNVHFTVAPEDSWVEKILPASDDSEDCTIWCNGTQAYYRSPSCRCALNDTEIPIYEQAECTSVSWEVFRQYDYRSQMSQTAYDVARRFLYQLVVVRLPGVENPVRHFIHAINVFENRPKWTYDTLLDRPVFNAVWDFRKSRLTALSWYPDDNGQLYFTVVNYNTSTHQLVVEQVHTLIPPADVASQALVTSTTSVDGMGTIDILYGTYYSVVPAYVEESQFVVHAIIAIDIDRRKVLQSVTLPITLMNLQMNSLHHQLYGAGMDLLGQLQYYEICNATNVTQTIGNVVRQTAQVVCGARILGQLPSQVNQMYLQSASIDHQYNFAWFTYKETPTGPPLILEYHQSDGEYLFWREDSLALEAGFTSLIQTAPRIIFTLYPPALESAIFNTAGTKIFLTFSSPTLQGAIPQDADGDEIPDFWREADRIIRAPCETFLDDFTMALIPNSMCQWSSDSAMFIEITRDATIMPGDLVRIRSNRIYAGRLSPSGVAQFSQPSTDFKPVQLPAYIPWPTADISGYALVDSCTDVTLDGEGSKDYGYRGPFAWSLARSDPVTSEPHMREIEQILRDIRLADRYHNPHIIRVPKYTLLENHTYYFSLNVTTLWNASMSSLAEHPVTVSALPVPPIVIYGPTVRVQDINYDLTITALIMRLGCLQKLPGFRIPVTNYEWTGCMANDTSTLIPSVSGCTAWDTSLLQAGQRITGKTARTLNVKAFTLRPNASYAFTVRAYLTETNGSRKVLSNVATVFVNTQVADFQPLAYGGNGFDSNANLPLVVDVGLHEIGCTGPRAVPGSQTTDVCQDIGGGATPEPFDTGNLNFSYSCTVVATGLPCHLGSAIATTTTAPDFGLGGDPDLGLGGGGGVVGGRRLEGGRRLADVAILEDNPCQQAIDPVSGKPRTMVFRGRTYDEALNITFGVPSVTYKYCMARAGVLMFQPDLFTPGLYEFQLNITKTIGLFARKSTYKVTVNITEEGAGALGRTPMPVLKFDSSLPVLPSEVFRLQGAVTNTQNSSVYRYQWSAFVWSANPLYDADQLVIQGPENYLVPRYVFVELVPPAIDFGSDGMVRTPSDYPYMALNPYVLSPNTLYKFRLTATDTLLEAQGVSTATTYTEYMFSTGGLPPSGGYLVVDNTTGSAFDTVFRFEMVGWGTEDFPLTYQFTYLRDPGDPYETATYLNPVYALRTFVDTHLPNGEEASDYVVRVTGYALSGIGVMATSNTVEVFVQPPHAQATKDAVDEISNLDPESSLMYAIMLVQTQVPANPVNDVCANVYLTVSAKGFDAAHVPETADTLTLSAELLGILADKGLRTQEVADTIADIMNRSLSANYIDADHTVVLGTETYLLMLTLLTATDSISPGLVTQVTPTTGRRLQAVDPIDNRTADMQYAHLMDMRGLQVDLGTKAMVSLYPREIPANFSVRGFELYLGKDFSLDDGTGAVQGLVRTTFSVPTLDRLSIDYGRKIYAYRYQLYKKFPYTFWDLPDPFSLDAPPEDSGSNAGFEVPRQNFPDKTHRMWHAVTLQINDAAGAPIVEEVDASLANVSFDRLPKIAASSAVTMGQYATIDHAATCFAVQVDGALPHFDSRGVTYERDSCVSVDLRDLVVLIDDLPKEIASFDLLSLGASLSITEDRPATAAVGALLICIIVGMGAGGFGIYVDEKQHERTPIDQGPRKVMDMDDPVDKLIATVGYTFWRNHLVFGALVKHKKLTRDKRVWVIMASSFGIQAVATVLHASTVIRFRATTQFIATGLVAAVLIFPLTVFMQFLYEWRPMTRTHSVAPPRSAPPSALESKDKRKEIAAAKSLLMPKRPMLPPKIRPPPKAAPPRVPAMSQLFLPVYGLPLDLPKLKVAGVNTDKIHPPPRLQPQRPRPPKEPPPDQHLTVSRAPGATLRSSFGGSGKPDPFGLKLPELPPLLQGSAVGAGMPAPPPKRPGVGPKPPQAPPPLNKMFYAVPQGMKSGPLRTPPLPPAKVGAKGPALPPLPKIMRPQDVLSAVRLSGDLPALPALPGVAAPSGGSPPPPPPPPRRAAEVGGPPPAPPETPREDFENSALPQRFVLDPEHTMMPPVPAKGKYAPPPPPLRHVGPKAPAGPGAHIAAVETALALPGMLQVDVPLRPPAAASRQLVVAGGSQLAVVTGGNDQLALVSAQPSALALAPMRFTPGQGKIPALPKDAPVRIPNAVLAKIPAVQKASGLLPPPPPPPVGGFGQLANLPLPPEEGEPTVVQKLEKFTAGPRRGGPPSRPPRPPPKLSNSTLKPTPPRGPPPAHAIVLARNAGGPGFDQSAIVAKVRPPSHLPKPPPGPPPSATKGELSKFVDAAVIDALARVRKEQPLPAAPIEGVDPFAAWKKDPREAVALAKRSHDEKAPKPVPDFMVVGGLGLVQGFVALNLLAFVAVITIYGTYLKPEAVFPTYAATIVGMIADFGVFESVKCVVIACLAMVHEETEKREGELRARQARMELKAQRLQQKGRRFSLYSHG